jgi:hypothetical protein
MASLPTGWTWEILKKLLEELKPLGKIISAEIDGAKMEAKGAIGFGGSPTKPAFKVKANAGGHAYVLQHQITQDVCSITIDDKAVDKPDLAIKEGVTGSLSGVTVWVKYIMLWVDGAGAKHKAAFRAEAKVAPWELPQLPF